MKDNIMYYYNLLEIENFEKRDSYYFKSDNKVFSLELVENIEKSKRVIDILQKLNYTKGYQIVFNIYGEAFTRISNDWYILLLHIDEQYNILNDLLHPINVSKILRVDFSYTWNYLWIKKVDYYEYQFKHISDIYPLILESFNYYIGLAENAISYFSYNIHSCESFDLFLCHERISYCNYLNPLNITVDYYARDVAEYIKFLFFSDNYRDFSFVSLFEALHFSYNDYILLFSRLLFPSYYFDVYDCIISNKGSEEDLTKIIFSVDKYYLFLRQLCQCIFLFVKIPQIDWIKK